MSNYSINAVVSSIAGFQKVEYPEAGLITYKGNNYSIRIKTVDTNSYIEFLDSDQSILEAKLTQQERLLKIIDFTNLSDKRGATTAEEYAEDIIQTDSTPQTTPVTGDSGGGGNVNITGNDTDFSTETTLAAVLAKITNDPSTSTKQDNIIAELTNILAKIDRYNPSYALPDTRALKVDDLQATDGGVTDPPYPLIAVRKKTGITNAAFIGFISAFNEQNDDFRIDVYRFDRNQITVRTSQTITWTELDSNLEGFAFPRTGISQFTPTSQDRDIGYFQGRDINNRDQNFTKIMEGDSYEYLIAWRGHTDGSDAYVSINPYSFNYQ